MLWIEERIAPDRDPRIGLGDLAELNSDVAFARIRAHRLREHANADLELRRHLIEHRLKRGRDNLFGSGRVRGWHDHLRVFNGQTPEVRPSDQRRASALRTGGSFIGLLWAGGGSKKKEGAIGRARLRS